MSAAADDRSTFSATVAGSVGGHLVVGVGNQIIEDADALLGPPHTVSPPLPLSNLPGTPTRVFVGRDEALARLDAVSGGGPLVTCVVHGLGGVGKSELVLHHASRHRGSSPIQWWITADAPDRIEAGLAALTAAVAARVGRVGPAAAPDAAAWAVGFLAARPGWLLVLDNVEDVGHIQPWLAALTGGRIVVTSRREADWEQLVDVCVRLEPLGTDAATELLLARSQQSDRVAAAALSAEVAGLPLALTQVGAYLAQTRTAMDDYLRRLRDRPAATLAVGAAGTPAQRTVARVWDITLASIAAVDAMAIDMLRVLSCLAADRVPRELLTHFAPEPGPLDDALGLLASYSMITLTADTVSTHRLVQTVVAAQAELAGVLPAVRAGALDAVRAAMPGSPHDIDEWPQWAALVPQVRALAAIWPADECDADLANLLGWTGKYLFEQGAYAAAAEMQRQALAIAEATLGPDHPEVAYLLDGLGLSLLELGRAAEAVPLQRRALAIGEEAIGPDHAYIAALLDNLAASLGAVDQDDEALLLRQRALTIIEAALGADDPAYATRLSNLAVSLSAVGRPDEALPLELRALEITLEALGPDHPAIATCLGNLASTLLVLDRVEESVPLWHRALAITEAALGPEHPDVATRLSDLAVGLAATNRLADARLMAQRAVEVSEAAFGPDHPDVAMYREHLDSMVDDTTAPRRRRWPLLRRGKPRRT